MIQKPVPQAINVLYKANAEINEEKTIIHIVKA